MSRDALITVTSLFIGVLCAAIFRWFFAAGSILPSIAVGGLAGAAAYWLIDFVVDRARSTHREPEAAVAPDLMTATLKGMALLDTEFDNGPPDDLADFSVTIRLFIGPSDEEGAEAFDVVYCSPKHLERESGEHLIFGHGYIIHKRYDLESFHETIAYQCRRCSGYSWDEIAAKLSLWAHWEFHDYRPYQPTLH